MSSEAAISKTRPFDGKTQEGILKNGNKTIELEAKMSDLNSSKVQDDATNNWRKKKDRMQLYNLQKNFS